MRDLSIRERIIIAGVLGAISGAAAVSIAWVATSERPDPAFRHTRLYDECLARGGSIMACDATMRVVQRKHDEAQREYINDFLATSKDHPKGHSFIDCFGPEKVGTIGGAPFFTDGPVLEPEHETRDEMRKRGAGSFSVAPPGMRE